MTNSVSTLHPDYKIAAERWDLIDAIVNNCAKKYLRTPDINDPERSTQYKDDGVLTNFTNITKIGLTGLVFRKPPEIELPEELQYLMEDVTGAGINVWQWSQYQVGELIKNGRFGLLVDYYDMGMAYIKPYIAKNIINWKTAVIDGKCVLSLVTLVEQKVMDEEDPFSQDTETVYRVLRLDDNGYYYQQIYNEDGDWVQDIEVTDYNGNYFRYIPFVFGGSENNDWTIDYQPLYDLARINLQHYRNSCDLEESIWINGQPYLVVNIGEESQDDFLQRNPGGVKYGSRQALVLASGGNAQLMQCNANQFVAQEMSAKIEQAARIGARLVETAGGRETAEAAKIRYGSQHSALYTLTKNMEWAAQAAFKMVCQFMGANPDEVEYELNHDYFDPTADANVLAQMILMSDRGIIAVDDVRDYGRRVGIIEANRTDEEIEQETDLINPLENTINDATQRNLAPSSAPNEADQEPGEGN